MTRKLAGHLAWLLLLSLPSASALSAQEEKPKPEETPEDAPKDKPRPASTEGYGEYLSVTEVKYVSAAEGGGSQSLQLKFDVSKDVPKGAVLRLTLDQFELPKDETTYTLKDDNRKGLSLTWKFSTKIATGTYRLRTYVDLEKQTAAVQKALKENPKAWPPKSAPWAWRCDPEVNVGSKADEDKERDEVCTTFTGLMDRLLENMGEFKESMDKALNKEDLAAGGSLDAKKFEAFVKGWREKQGAIQKEIVLLAGKLDLSSKSEAARAGYRQLGLFGQMVSKRATQLQKAVAEKYKVTDVNPKVKDFDKSKVTYIVEPRHLEDSYKNIRQLLGCPEEQAEEESAGEEPAADGAAATEDGAKEPEKDAKPEEGQNPPEEPAPKEEKDSGKKGKESPKKEGGSKEAGRKDSGKKETGKSSK